MVGLHRPKRTFLVEGITCGRQRYERRYKVVSMRTKGNRKERTRCQEHLLRTMKVILGCLYFIPWKIKNYLMFFKQGEWHAQYVF